jgi:hypothetical protein
MKKILISLCLPLIWFACTQEGHLPVSTNLGKPAPVTEVKTVPIPGGAIVSYKIPDTDDLLAIKAVYALSNGKHMEVMASYFVDTLKLEGFVDMLEHEVTLYSISRSQVLSDPVKVYFTPLESSLSKVIKTVQIFADFGGATFQWKNEDNALLMFDLLAENEQGIMMTTNIFQNKHDSMEYSIRGYATEPRKFAINISDQWRNESGLVYPEGEKITPLREDKLDKSSMKIMRLSGDSEFNIWGGMDLFMLDDDNNTFGHSTPVDWPPYITIDLGKKAKLSRIVINQRFFENMYYNGANWSVFDIYKCKVENLSQNAAPGEWEKVMECKMEKPSGMPLNECTNEDLRQAKKGDSFAFPRELEPVRYIRIGVVQTWGYYNYSFNSEITFYGSYAE